MSSTTSPPATPRNPQLPEDDSRSGPGAQPRRLRIGLTAKLVCPLFLFFLAFSAALGTWIADFSKDTFLRQAEDRVRTLHDTAYHLLHAEWQRLGRRMQDPFLDLNLEVLVRRRLENALGAAMEDLAFELGVHYIEVRDIDGELLAGSTRDPDSPEPAFSAALGRQISAEMTEEVFLAKVPAEVLPFMGMADLSPVTPSGKTLAVVASATLTDDFEEAVGHLVAYRFLNGDQESIAHVGKLIGATVTLLQGGIRIATNSTDAAGNSLLASPVQEGIHDAVVAGGNQWLGRSEIGGVPHITKYIHLMGRDGRDVGALGVGVEITEFLQRVLDVRNRILVAGAAALALFSALLVFVIRKSLRAVRTILDYLRAVSDGNLGLRLQVNTGDELQTLAEGVDDTVGTLRHLVASVSRAFQDVETISGDLLQIGDTLEGSADAETQVLGNLNRSAQSLAEIVDSVTAETGCMHDTAKENRTSLNEIATLVQATAHNAERMNDASQRTSAAAEGMASGIGQVAGSIVSLHTLLDNTATAMNDIDRSVGEVSGYAADAKEVSQELANEAEQQGREAMGRAEEGMRRIDELIGVLERTVRAVGRKSESIGEILQLTGEIADQTNMLALNAAILAAQAGHHGQGFTVVAAEVRTLSQKTRTSLGAIEEHIHSIQEESSRAVEQTSRGLEVVAEGVREVHHVRSVLERIIAGAGASRDLVERIALQTRAQASSSSQVTGALHEIAASTQQLSATAQELDATAMEMLSVAQEVGQRSAEVKQAAVEEDRSVTAIRDQVASATDTADRLATVVAEAAGGAATLQESTDLVDRALQQSADGVSRLQRAVASLDKGSKQVRQHLSRFNLKNGA